MKRMSRITVGFLAIAFVVAGCAHQLSRTDWVTLIDNVTVNSTTTPGVVNILTPAVKSGASFTATVLTNGQPAIGATGTVTFRTNNVQLSANGMSFGVASSAAGILRPPYTVTGIYSGDVRQ